VPVAPDITDLCSLAFREERHAEHACIAECSASTRQPLQCALDVAEQQDQERAELTHTIHTMAGAAIPILIFIAYYLGSKRRR